MKICWLAPLIFFSSSLEGFSTLKSLCPLLFDLLFIIYICPSLKTRFSHAAFVALTPRSEATTRETSDYLGIERWWRLSIVFTLEGIIFGVYTRWIDQWRQCRGRGSLVSLAFGRVGSATSCSGEEVVAGGRCCIAAW